MPDCLPRKKPAMVIFGLVVKVAGRESKECGGEVAGLFERGWQNENLRNRENLALLNVSQESQLVDRNTLSFVAGGPGSNCNLPSGRLIDDCGASPLYC